MIEKLYWQRYKHQARTIKHASAELQNNREVILAAVQQDGSALQFAGLTPNQ